MNNDDAITLREQQKRIERLEHLVTKLTGEVEHCKSDILQLKERVYRAGLSDKPHNG